MALISMSDPLLKIANHHTAACGDPPIVDGSAENCYVGYFENPYGEQWIFTLDRGTGKRHCEAAMSDGTRSSTSQTGRLLI